MPDIYSAYQVGLGGPAIDGEAVDVSSTDHTCANTTRALWVGTTGDVQVTMAGGGDVTFTNVPSGTLLPVRVTVVVRAGTDASDIFALW